jgi:hypothetical protein
MNTTQLIVHEILKYLYFLTAAGAISGPICIHMMRKCHHEFEKEDEVEIFAAGQYKMPIGRYEIHRCKKCNEPKRIRLV